MASGEETSSLKLYWDHFFKAETGTYEKSTWLELFLAEFIIRLNEGANPKELINFCPVSGVVSLVGCELLCGIHRVTSSINTHFTPNIADLNISSNNDVTPYIEPQAEELKVQPTGLFSRNNALSSTDILKKYLLSGIAWKCLVLLKALGVEGLSCCRQLSSVLSWLWGELGSAGGGEGVVPSEIKPRTPIHQLFSHKIWTKQKIVNNQSSKPNSAASSERGSASTRSRYTNQQNKGDSTDSKLKRKSYKPHDLSTESCDSNDDLEVLNRSLTIKVCSQKDDFNYFDSPIREDADYAKGSFYSDSGSPRKVKPKADDYMSEKHKQVIHSEITAFEFSLLITDLLHELCATESSLAGSEGSLISVQCINFALKNLCSLQFGSLPASSLQNNQQVSRIKVALTELLIVSLDKVLVCSDLCAKLINNGILPMLLRILEDVVCKSSNKYSKKEERSAKNIETQSKTESENMLKFVFGIAYSITAFFHCLLMQCRSVDKLREFTEQFKLYGECLKGGLLKECIELMVRIQGVEPEEITVLVKKLITSIGKLVSGMKRVRSEVMHSAACPRMRHKVCRQRVIAGMHHHHEILGEARTGLPLTSACCISVLYGTLTSLAADEEVSAKSSLRNKILYVMLHCGVCCCFSPGFLMESIVRLMLTHNSVANLCLQVLENTVYGELGANVLMRKVSDHMPCSICELSSEKRDPTKKFLPVGVSPIERKGMWSFLIHYNSLMQLDNHNNVLHATVSHLLRVTPKCRSEMKYELLFSVIYPTFIVAKHRYILRMEETAYFVTVSCLNIFASLLNTVSFAEQFIQKGGLSYVLELVSLSEFSKQCCAILEITIIVEIYKLMKENSDMTYYREMGSLTSVQMLFKSLSEMTDKFFRTYKIKLTEDQFEELCDLTREREMLMLNQGTKLNKQGKVTSMSLPIKSNYPIGENAEEDSIEDYLEILKNIWTFWKSCAGLCHYSPMFREYILSDDVFLDSYAMLKIVLYYLCNCDCGTAEMRVLIKIMEALISVQFALSDVTSGRSKDTSCVIIRAALVSPEDTLEGSAVLQLLCEALIRVGVEAPRVTHTKVPPLVCASGVSSVECSSSEESVEVPYNSEHSEPFASRADDGYEADIELSYLHQDPSNKRRLAESISNFNGISGRKSPPLESISLECGGYVKNKELSHPELCIIVVDILTQLIQKILTSVESGTGSTAAQTAAAALARACAASLCPALPPRPSSLQRLLAHAPAAALTSTRPQLEDLRRSILDLIQVLASQSIEPSELAALLQLFKAPEPPLGQLLALLNSLTNVSNCPDCVLTFPATGCPDNLHTATDEANITASQNQQAENMAKLMYDAHIKNGLNSVWARGAARVGVEGAGWAAWLHPFAALVWLRTQAKPQHNTRNKAWETIEDWQDDSMDTEPRKSKSPMKKETNFVTEMSHVLSIGHDSLLFEMWLDTNAGAVTFRLSRLDLNSYKVMSERRVEATLSPHRWHCLALNVKEVVHKRRVHIQVTLFVNGLECETVSLPLQGILVRKMCPTIVLFGDTRAGSGVYHSSGFRLFRAPCFTTPTALYCTASHHHHPLLVQDEHPNYPLLITPATLDANIDWDQVYEMSSATIRELQDNLLLTYSAHAPNIINLYHQTVQMPNVFAGRVPSSGLLNPQAHGSSIPETLYCRWVGNPLPSRHRGFAPALYMLGGPDVLLYLFARVIELKGSAEEQALALSILLKVCLLDNRLYSQLYGDEYCLHMILSVLHNKSTISSHLIKVIFEAACDAPVLACSGNCIVVSGKDAAIVEPKLLILLVKAWKFLHTDEEIEWELEMDGTRETYKGTLWSLAMSAMCSLLTDEHPRRSFNHYQLNRLDLLRHLLLACKECFLNSEDADHEPLAWGPLVPLVGGLLGSPPLLAHLAMLCDFLLLMHQASDTFVTHSRANFYFLLTPETPEMNEFNFLNFMTKRKPSKRSRRRNKTETSEAATQPSNVDTPTEMTRENSLKSLQDATLNRDDGSERLDPDSSLDSAKHLKGIINAQIKEGRKHNASSTSENSDVTIEYSCGDVQEPTVLESEASAEASAEAEAEAEAKAEQTLSDYIVVDEDDFKHTTVEMYSSGIYHQERVRAGGGAGGRAAVAGLLRLLTRRLQALSQHHLLQAVNGVIQVESIVVVCNAWEDSVRAAAVRLLTALQRRATVELNRKLKQNMYYCHLANQISLYPGSWELASACAALVTKCDVTLEDQLDEDIWRDVSAECMCRSPPLVALLAVSLHDVPLAHNLALILRKIIDKVSLKTISEIAIVEVVIRSLRTIGMNPDTTFEGRELIIEDLQDLLNRVAGKALASQYQMQTVLEIHHLLTYIEMSTYCDSETTVSRQSQDEAAAVRRVARDAQVSLYIAQLDFIEERLHSSIASQSRPANYFTTVLTSAVSLTNEGVTRTELATRHLATVNRAVNFLTTQSPLLPVHTEADLVDRLLNTLIPAVSGQSGSRPKWWSGSVEWSGALWSLIWWSGRSPSLQAPLLKAMYHAQLPLIPTHPPDVRKLAVLLLTALQNIHLEAQEGRSSLELPITDWVRGWALAVQGGLADRLPPLQDEAERDLRKDMQRWTSNVPNNIAKVVFSKEVLVSKVTESAMSITRVAVELQNGERKAFMEHLRLSHSHTQQCLQKWQSLIDRYTHEQALWHDPASYPQSWQLDSTEGPGRVRVRLQRTHLNIHPKFLKPQHRHKVENRMESCLRGVVGGGRGGGGGGAVTRLQPHETVAHMTQAAHVTVDADHWGELLLTDRCIHFVPEESSPTGEAQSWSLDQLCRVSLRRWCLQELALELFLSSGHAHLIAFTHVSERTSFLKALNNSNTPNRKEPETLAEAMSQWRNGSITNWEYLMKLNDLGGRTYNDLMQYPVLPFVIADYTSRILDLTDQKCLRDLTRPMAVQNKKREQHYINTYNDLTIARREGCSPLLSRAPHHYASLYSNSGGVLHYLVRLPPFTQLFLQYQDNNFDMPDRTFHSLQTTWRLITKDSPTDVKELIPEMFYLPEMFLNNEGLNLGRRQCGAEVDRVELPAWGPDARLFTLIHRQALEVPHVTDTLAHWIDLVFGYKQTGQPAIDAINVFPACTYYGFDPSALEDEVDRTAAAAMVRTYGQAPRQLLRQPHPHAAPDLSHHNSYHQGVSVWDGVVGLRWGRYAGSPGLGPATLVARRGGGAALLHAAPLPRAVLTTTHKQKPLPYRAGSQSGPWTLGSLATVSWGHSDGVLRLKRRRDYPHQPILNVCPLDQITCVSTSCSGRAGTEAVGTVVVGYTSGRVVVLRPPRAAPAPLHAHAAPVADMFLCAALLATASRTGTIVLWDLTSLSYIRTVPNRDMLPVTHVTISETLCDVASVHDVTLANDVTRANDVTKASDVTRSSDDNSDSYEKDAHNYKSLIRVHTVNGSFVGSVKVSERVTCICYSNAPEGVSVNCVAAGLDSGGVRLYSSWDLRPVTYIPSPATGISLVSITYSSDSQVLFGCYSDGSTAAWESEPAGSAPKILPLHH